MSRPPEATARRGALAGDLAVLRQLLRGIPRGGSHAQNLQGFYAAQAPDYDRFRERLLRGRAELMARLVSDLPPSARIVELGAGTGRNVDFFGAALADVILGAYNPGGHTVATWPTSVDQLPPMLDYDIRHGRTYMYAKGKPLYPFGYGLSYTSFRYANLRTDKPVLAKNGVATVSVDVTNTGKIAGDAVPQLYAHHLGSKVARPVQQLVGFQRVRLAPGETKTVWIPLKAATLAYWDGKALTVEAEPVEVRIGSSSANIKLRRTLQVR